MATGTCFSKAFTLWSSVHPESTLFEIKKQVFICLVVNLKFCHAKCDFYVYIYVCVYTHTKKLRFLQQFFSEGLQN